MKEIIHFKVGKGNCCVVKDDDFVMVIDITSTEEKESYEIVSPHFREKDGKDCIDVLVVTHNDKDHCGGFTTFKEKMDSGELIIGKIIHQDYDRTKSKKDCDSEYSDDYKKFQEEVDRREALTDAEFGDLVFAPKNGEEEDLILEGVNYPEDLNLLQLSPFEGDDETTDYDVNDLSLVFRLDFENLNGMLFCGDSSSKYWQDKVIPEYLQDNSEAAESEHCVVSHHGSYSFFGKDREKVRDADPEPDNYEALDYIEPDELIISAEMEFPTRDKKRDNPPHYAAYKWYHKWFRDNRDVSENDQHPDNWHYTSNGNIQYKYENNEWSIVNNYVDEELEEAEESSAKRLGELHKKGALGILPGLSAPKTRYYGSK
jgi:beta-lactamase superfamily II metal-dependent hydrolase